jgi:hypothetical protein
LGAVSSLVLCEFSYSQEVLVDAKCRNHVEKVHSITKGVADSVSGAESVCKGANCSDASLFAIENSIESANNMLRNLPRPAILDDVDCISGLKATAEDMISTTTFSASDSVKTKLNELKDALSNLLTQIATQCVGEEKCKESCLLSYNCRTYYLPQEIRAELHNGGQIPGAPPPGGAPETQELWQQCYKKPGACEMDKTIMYAFNYQPNFARKSKRDKVSADDLRKSWDDYAAQSSTGKDNTYLLGLNCLDRSPDASATCANVFEELKVACQTESLRIEEECQRPKTNRRGKIIPGKACPKTVAAVLSVCQEKIAPAKEYCEATLAKNGACTLKQCPWSTLQPGKKGFGRDQNGKCQCCESGEVFSTISGCAKAKQGGGNGCSCMRFAAKCAGCATQSTPTGSAGMQDIGGGGCQLLGCAGEERMKLYKAAFEHCVGSGMAKALTGGSPTGAATIAPNTQLNGLTVRPQGSGPLPLSTGSGGGN